MTTTRKIKRCPNCGRPGTKRSVPVTLCKATRRWPAGDYTRSEVVHGTGPVVAGLPTTDHCPLPLEPR